MDNIFNNLLGAMDKYGNVFGRVLSTIVAGITTFAFVNTMAQIF